MALRDLTDQERDNLPRELVELDKSGDGLGILELFINTLIKAARILRDPRGWPDIKTDDVGPFTPKEAADLEREQQEAESHIPSRPLWLGGRDQPAGQRFWHTPKELRTTIITLCFAAMAQGWVQAAFNGANLTWPTDTGLILSEDQKCDSSEKSAWIFAIVNAAPWFSASIFSLLVTDPATEILFGRRAAIIMAGLFTLGGSIGGGLAKNWQQLLVCRILVGLGMGCKASVVPVFAAEVAPTRMRGSLVMNWQLFDTLGILAGFSANLIFSPLGKNSWRWMTASPALPTIILLALAALACPESPRFLMSRHRFLEAYETLTRLRGSRILAAKELVYIHYQLQFEQEQGISRPRSSQSSNREGGIGSRDVHQQKYVGFWTKLVELFTVPRNRNALVTALVCMIAQQLCGVNVLILYSSTIFKNVFGPICSSADSISPHDIRGALLSSWGIGLTNFIFTFPAYWLIDRKGRRWLLMATIPFLCVFMGCAALSYVNGGNFAILSVFTYLFIAFYSWGMGPVPFTISAEVFPLDHRVVGMSVAVSTNFFFVGLLTLVVPVITESSLGAGGLLGIFAFLNILAFVMVTYLVRETVTADATDNPNSMEPLALEDLYKIFDISTSKVLEHQTTKGVHYSLRWFVWRCWPFAGNQEGPKQPEPLWWLWEQLRHGRDIELTERSGGNHPPGDEADILDAIEGAE